MAREQKRAYEDYKTLNLSKEIEDKWRKELFIILYEQLKETRESALFNGMYHLAENFHNKESLIIMKEALNYIRYDSIENKLCISETVIGRKEITVRSGMIFWAFDLNEIELSEELLKHGKENLVKIEELDK